MKTAKEFWEEKFDESPQSDADKLAVAMMAEYGDYISSPVEPEVIKPLGGSALKCKNNGWKVGDRLTGNEGYGDTIIQITAIGEDGILAKQLSHDGIDTPHTSESNWTLSCRDWKKVL